MITDEQIAEAEYEFDVKFDGKYDISGGCGCGECQSAELYEFRSYMEDLSMEAK